MGCLHSCHRTSRSPRASGWKLRCRTANCKPFSLICSKLRARRAFASVHNTPLWSRLSLGFRISSRMCTSHRAMPSIFSRGTGSLMTPRWRELDSNDRYRLTRPRFQGRLMSPLMVSISGRKPPSLRRVLATGRRTSRSSRPLVECGKLTQAAALPIGARRRTQLIHRTPVAGCQTTSGTGGQFRQPAVLRPSARDRVKSRDSLIRRINSLMTRVNSLLGQNNFPVPRRRELGRK